MKKYVARRAIVSAVALPFIAGVGPFLWLTAELIAPWLNTAYTLANAYSTSLTAAIALGFGWTFEPILAKLLKNN